MHESTPIRLLIASNDSRRRSKLVSLSKKLPFPTIVVTAQNGQETVNLQRKYQPDVVFLDTGMPSFDGHTPIEAIRIEAPNAEIVLLSSSRKSTSVTKALHVGAGKVLGRNATFEELLDCVRSVHERRDYEVSGRGYSESARKMRLTKRELEVLSFVAADMSNKEIGTALSITEGTVKIHIHHILSKLGVNTRTGAIAKGLKDRLL